MFPIVSFERVEPTDADARLVRWGHYLGACDRPFGRQDFALVVRGAVVSVCTSASTVSATCAGYSRYEVVELARLVTDPRARWATRVALRLWRELAPAEWVAEYREHWARVVACVSYSNATRHTGDVYRFDGWRKVAVMPGSAGGGTHTRRRATREDKAVWVYAVEGGA